MPRSPAGEPADHEAIGWATNVRRGGAALVVLAVASLLPAIFAPFVADDYFHAEEALDLRRALTQGWVLPIHLGGAWWSPADLQVEYFRPLIVASFAIDRLIYGLHAAGYHLTNLVLHATATLLVWAIARRVLGRGFGAWAAAALFAVHPCHVQAVGWISGRTDVLASLFYLGALAIYLESRERPGARVALSVVSVLVFLLALTAKEMAITFPVVVFAHGLLRPQGEPPARRLLVPALAAVAAVLYVAVRVTILGGIHPPPTPFAFHFGDPGLLWHLVTEPLLYLGDFTLFVPTDPVVTVPFWQAHPLLLLLFAATVVLTFARTLRLARDRATALWGLGWIGVTLIPVVMLPLGEHFLYLPSVGYCILVGSQLPHAWEAIDARGRRAMAIVGGLVMLVCLGRTISLDVVERSSSRTIDEAAAALDRFPAARLLLVADLPTGASLAFGLAVSFARDGRKADVGILSILPALIGGDTARSMVTPAPPDRLVMSRDEGFLHSYVERALAGPRTSFSKGETFERDGYAVTVLDAPEGHLRSFETRIEDPAHTLVLGESEHGLVPLNVGITQSPPAPRP